MMSAMLTFICILFAAFLPSASIVSTDSKRKTTGDITDIDEFGLLTLLFPKRGFGNKRLLVKDAVTDNCELADNPCDADKRGIVDKRKNADMRQYADKQGYVNKRGFTDKRRHPDVRPIPSNKISSDKWIYVKKHELVDKEFEENHAIVIPLHHIDKLGCDSNWCKAAHNLFDSKRADSDMQTYLNNLVHKLISRIISRYDDDTHELPNDFDFKRHL